MTTKFKTIQSKFNASKRRATLSYDGTIVRRKANTMIPSLYLEKVIEANPHGWGAAMLDTSDGSLMLRSDIEAVTAVEIVDVCKEFMDRDITFFFCNSTNALSLADVSPHVLLAEKVDKEEVPKVVAFVTGNFPNFEKAGSAHPPIYHLVEDYLCPKFEGLAETLDNDLDKITDAIQKPFFKKELLLTSVSRGTFTIIASNGVAVTFDQNDLSAEYPWGWASNTHGYVEGDGKKKKPGLFSRSTVREAAPSANIAEAVKPPASDAAVIKNWSVRKISPAGTLSRNEAKEWYKRHIGYFPPKGEDRIAVNAYFDPKGKLSTFAEMNKALGLAAAGLIKSADNPARQKDTSNDHIESGEKPSTAEAVSVEILPIMSPPTRKWMEDYMKTAQYKKIIAENADLIMDPAKVQGLETKFTDFGAQMGLKNIDEFLQWDYEMFLYTATQRPQASALLNWTFRNIIAKTRFKELKKEIVSETKVEPEVEVETPPAKKPGLFSRSRSAA